MATIPPTAARFGAGGTDSEQHPHEHVADSREPLSPPRRVARIGLRWKGGVVSSFCATGSDPERASVLLPNLAFIAGMAPSMIGAIGGRDGAMHRARLPLHVRASARAGFLWAGSGTCPANVDLPVPFCEPFKRFRAGILKSSFGTRFITCQNTICDRKWTPSVPGNPPKSGVFLSQLTYSVHHDRVGLFRDLAEVTVLVARKARKATHASDRRSRGHADHPGPPRHAPLVSGCLPWPFTETPLHRRPPRGSGGPVERPGPPNRGTAACRRPHVSPRDPESMVRSRVRGVLPARPRVRRRLVCGRVTAPSAGPTSCESIGKGAASAERRGGPHPLPLPLSPGTHLGRVPGVPGL